MPKATIAVIEGIARGGGSELAMAFDMRFAALNKARLAQPEVALGIIPCGGGTQRLPQLVGRARAMEVILGCDDIDAATAEAWGYVNRALPADQLRPFVDQLANRIASYRSRSSRRPSGPWTPQQATQLPGS
jgi:enoyl-CoA hydratase/carnithine racemase